LPNLTGTPYAYNPENIHGKVIELKTKKKPVYEPWKPNG
jgi:hypothetical protein